MKSYKITGSCDKLYETVIQPSKIPKSPPKEKKASFFKVYFTPEFM